MKKAIVLLSGGLDSTTTLYYALNRDFKIYCLIFHYGQRHDKEVKTAVRMAKQTGCAYRVVRIPLPWKGSALLDKKISLPQRRRLDRIGALDIPATYVPARNIIFMSFAASFAESVGAQKIFIGANARDYSGYPDCRPEFFKAYSKVLECATRTGVEGRAIQIETPLVHKSKSQIIKMGLKLKVPYHLTWSCYRGGKLPCGVCDSCLLRKKGFTELKLRDPLSYG